MAVWSALDAPSGEVEPDGSVLREAVASELAVDADELSAEQLGTRSLRLRREIDGLSVAVARTDAVFEATRAFRSLDPACTKASQWLAKQTRVPIKQARAAYRQARRLALLPAVQAAVIAGTITLWHALSVSNLASSPARVRQLRSDTAALVDAADLSAREFRLRLRLWAQEHFAEEVEADALTVDEARTASVGRTESGAPRIAATLAPVAGTAVLNELGRIESELFKSDWEAAKTVHGTKTRFEHLGRSAEQRRADALVEMATRSEAASPGASSRRPLVSVLVGFDAVRSRVAEIEDGTYVTTDQALRAMAVADLERAVLGPDDRIAVSRKTRLFTGAERRAVEIRDRHCTETGCDLPPERCDVDHVQRFEHGGETHQANGKLKCVGHHEGRRADAESRPQPWEYAEGEWDSVDTERTKVVDELRRSA